MGDFHSLEIVGRGSETRFQVSANLNYLINVFQFYEYGLWASSLSVIYVTSKITKLNLVLFTKIYLYIKFTLKKYILDFIAPISYYLSFVIQVHVFLFR